MTIVTLYYFKIVDNWFSSKCFLKLIFTVPETLLNIIRFDDNHKVLCAFFVCLFVLCVCVRVCVCLWVYVVVCVVYVIVKRQESVKGSYHGKPLVCCEHDLKLPEP